MPKFIVDSVENGLVTLKVPGFNYANSFVISAETAAALAGKVGARVRGTIHAPAWKVDRVELGGNYVEPLYGRPRRMQGTILAVDSVSNSLTVQVGYEATVRLGEKYRASDFAVGERVGWDNIEIPSFQLEAVAAAVG